MVSPGRVAFTVLGIDVMWYGVLIGFAFLLGSLICMKRAPKHECTADFVTTFMIWLIPAAVVGARAYYVLFRLSYYIEFPSEILKIRSGGLAIHGGLIVGFIVAYFLAKHYKIDFLKLSDLCICVVPLCQAIGRWGNFFNEEAHGIETDLPWAQIIDGVGYHPTFLYESIWCFLLFIFLIWFDDHKRSFDGQMLSLYMILYSFERFLVEGLRTDSLMIGNLRQAQVFSLALILGGVILYVILEKRQQKIKASAAAVAEVALDSSDTNAESAPEVQNAENNEQ